MVTVTSRIRHENGFRDGFVWTVGLTIQTKLCFSVFLRRIMDGVSIIVSLTIISIFKSTLLNQQKLTVLFPPLSFYSN